jgi:pyridoxamine 5'-phosphate oxidase
MPISVHSTPVVHFDEWFAKAVATGMRDPNAASLATASPSGMPSVRVVLLKGHDERGFVFYTNFESDKSRDLLANPQACLNFHWPLLSRQVRVNGTVERVTDEEADAYFATRPRASQLGAWASIQSRPMAEWTDFESRLREFERSFSGGPVPRPSHWSGWRILHSRVEFWREGEFRLHERLVYLADGKGGWTTKMLYP